jgi:hypothetical protein
MSVITPDTSKGQLVPFHFAQADVAASQTDVQLKVLEIDTASDESLNVDEISMPFKGEVVGISYNLSAAGTAGTLGIGVTINGTEDADTTQSITTAQRGYDTFTRGSVPFNAGDRLGVEITTNGAWDGTSADLLVTVWVLVYLEAI